MKNCLVCNENKFQPIYSDTLLKCENCGFVTANIEIGEELLKNIYSENYFKGEEYLDYLRDKEILQTNFTKRLNYSYKFFKKSEIKNALEIGCAYGFFAETITNEIDKISYIGFDIVPEAIEYGANKLKQNIFCKDYLATPIENKMSDIFMWDVIEHLPEPDKFISKASSELQSGGRIYITTGDIEKLIPKIQKSKWRMIHPPTHLHYFSKRTLSKLLEKNNFKVLAVSYPPIYRSVRQIFYSLFMLNKKHSAFVKFMYELIPAKMNVPINTFDIMFVIAQKK